MRQVIPLISVIVPTLNRPVELGQALASITGQQGVDPGELEVIVVNDGAFLPRHPARWPKARRRWRSSTE